MKEFTAQPAAYCASPMADAWLRTRVDAARDFVTRAVGRTQLEGLILTGSLARGEGSVAALGERLTLLGDIEFLLIVKPQPRWRDFRRQVGELSRRAAEAIGEGADGLSIEYTPADRSYLRERARPSMFTYDLRQHGRVLVGDPELLQEIPTVERSAIPAEDAMETLVNRGLELLALRDSGLPSATAGYASVKTLLDLAGSALAFGGTYESLYSRRPCAFRDLLARRDDLRQAVVSSERLAELVDDAARIKLEPTLASLTRIGREAEPRSILQWVIDLWRWEAGQLFDRTNADLETLMGAYLAEEGGVGRFRGWVKYGWHPLRPPTVRLAPRLLPLAAKSSPRRLVYAAALHAIEGAPGWEGRVVRILPTSSIAREGVLRDIVGTWKWLIRNN